jgi:site-specific DNA recombinase
MHLERDVVKSPKAIVYTRVSTAEQVREGLSLEAQEHSCREYCKNKGYEVAQVFVEEGESAKTANRTKLKELLKYCRDHKDIDFLIVNKLDRFSRNAADSLHMRDVLAVMGVKLRSVTEQIDDTPFGKFAGHVLAGLAELDNSTRSERCVTGMRQKLEMGCWTFSPPLGYRFGTDPIGNKNLVPDRETAPLVRLAFERMASGEHTQEKILQELTTKGLRSRKGEKLSKQTLHGLLRRPVYSGRIVVEDWGIDVHGSFTPIVPSELFNRVQMVLDGKRPHFSPYNRNSEDFPLRRFVRCAECGAPMTGSWSKGRNKRYAYYHCLEGCTRISKDELESEFVEYLSKLKPTSEYFGLFKEIVRDVWKSKLAESNATQTRCERNLNDLQSRKAKLEKAFVYDGHIDAATYRKMNAELREEILTLEMELTDSKSESLEVESLIEYAESILLNAPDFWRAAGLDEKQRFQQVLFPEGVEYSGMGFGTTTTCLFFSGIEAKDGQKEEMVGPCGLEPETSTVSTQPGDETR